MKHRHTITVTFDADTHTAAEVGTAILSYLADKDADCFGHGIIEHLAPAVAVDAIEARARRAAEA